MKRYYLHFPYVYMLLCIIVYIVALPFLVASVLRTKHKDSIPQRFFGAHFKLPFKPQYWFHACSFGEVKSLEPIIIALLNRPKPPLVLITTITHTGYAEAHKLFRAAFPAQVCVKFLPFEIFLPLWRRKLTHLKSLVVMEAELWKMLFFIAKSTRAKTFLLNARISDKSQKSYERFGRFYKGIFANIDMVLAQSRKDKKRLQALGARDVSVFGNLKMLNPPKVSRAYHKSAPLIVLGASTHKGEEELVVRSFVEFKRVYPHAQLILAPRHPERFGSVCEMLSKMGLKVTRLSELGSELRGEIIVADRLGELVNLYAISDVVVLGGSLVPKVGGHNPLEPAFFGTRLISGKHIFNQQALFACVQNAKLIESSELTHTLLEYEGLPPASVEFRANALEEILTLIV
ncbi:lipid IV(A) 3-deoxy-D-manno-octulosonic acid transferase [uncultured Helicobacter sp.]|uniref:lipid IV(A) 3-deoxy-D-manno-octulosonic acid transferase n=1 Tax=uncultured Helicobacter sp. TaxID=175537 RepID=UPI0037502D1A